MTDLTDLKARLRQWRNSGWTCDLFVGDESLSAHLGEVHDAIERLQGVLLYLYETSEDEHVVRKVRQALEG